MFKNKIIIIILLSILSLAIVGAFGFLYYRYQNSEKPTELSDEFSERVR